MYYHYQRDAQGNVLMMYKQEFDNKGEGKYESNINVVDIPIYGSSRLGTDNKEQTIKTVFYADIVDGKFSKYTGSVNLTSTTISGSGSIFSGNKIGITGSGSGLTIELYSAIDSVYLLDTTLQVNKGVLLSGTNGIKILPPLTYVEISTDDTLKIDSLLSSLQYRVLGTPTVVGPGPLQITPAIFGNTYVNTLGRKQYELTNHLGNVLSVVKDNKIPIEGTGTNAGTIEYFSANVDAYSDYYPFGQLMPGRNASSGDYRYGFNGKENDNEVKGVTGSQQDYGMRIYDTRIAKFLSRDPLSRNYPYLTPYQFASNTPIQAIDLDGLEAVKVDSWQQNGEEYKSTTLYNWGDESGKVQLIIHDWATGDIINEIWYDPVNVKYEPSFSEKLILGIQTINSARNAVDNYIADIPNKLDRLQARSMGSWDNYGELEHAVNRTGIEFGAQVSSGAFSAGFEIGTYSTSENNVGFYFSASFKGKAQASSKGTSFNNWKPSGKIYGGLYGSSKISEIKTGWSSQSLNYTEGKASYGLFNAGGNSEGGFNIGLQTPSIDASGGETFEFKISNYSKAKDL